MSKQQGYQHLSGEHAPEGEDYGFAARLPQAGGSYQTDKASSSSSGAGVPPPMAYPASAYAGAPVTGYPVMTPSTAGGMAPLGLGLEDPLGRRDRKRARREARREAKREARRHAGGAHGGDKHKAKPALIAGLVAAGVGGPVGMLVGGPVRLLVGLVRHAVHAGKEHHEKQSVPPAHHPGSSNQEPESHLKF